MFASAVRSQARLALVAARVPVTRAASQLVQRKLAITALPVSRSFSTSLLRFYENDFGSRAARSNPPSAVLFVGNLPWNVSEEELSQKFAPFGQIVSIRIASGPDGRSRGFAHVEFSSQEEAANAINSAAEEPFYVGDRDIRLDYSAGKAASPPSSRLYFKNFLSDEADLRSTFTGYEDAIVDVHFLRNFETGETNGSGFVEFESINTATEVVKKFSQTPTAEGGTLMLEYAKPKRERSIGGFQRRDGGRQQSSRGGEYSRGGGEYSRGGGEYSRGGGEYSRGGGGGYGRR